MSYVLDGVTYYTVRFLNETSTNVWGTADVPSGGDATNLAPTPKVREGKVFVGWNRSLTNITKDTTVSAVYALAVTVTFMNYAGTGTLSVQTIAQGSDAVEPTPEVIEGREFVGWDTSFTNVQTDIMVRPLYESGQATVQYVNASGNGTLDIQYVDKGGNAIPPAPERVAGSIFVGWSQSSQNVSGNMTVYPIYREIPTHPVLNFYRKNTDNSSGAFVRAYKAVNGCTITQKLDGECTIEIKLLTRMLEGIVGINDIVEVEGLVFLITEVKKSISGGVCYSELSGEHISYLLNNEEYNVTAFEMSGPPNVILNELLSDTPLSVGVVEMNTPVTLLVNREATRRALVMQLIALVGGEIEYYGYTVGIRAHMGSASQINVMKTANVRDISCSYNATEQRYNFNLELYRKGALQLGDELKIEFAPLGINIKRRLVGMEWNPFNFREVSITVGSYLPTLNDSLYELISSVEDITQRSAKYTIEFGEIIGNGTFYFTRSYTDRPYFQIQTSDGCTPTITLIRKDASEFNPYIGATISGANSDTATLVVFYLTVPTNDEPEEDEEEEEDVIVVLDE